MSTSRVSSRPTSSAPRRRPTSGTATGSASRQRTATGTASGQRDRVQVNRRAAEPLQAQQMLEGLRNNLNPNTTTSDDSVRNVGAPRSSRGMSSRRSRGSGRAGATRRGRSARRAGASRRTGRSQQAQRTRRSFRASGNQPVRRNQATRGAERAERTQNVNAGPNNGRVNRNRLASDANQIARSGRAGSGRNCYRGVKWALARQGVNLHGVSAYMAAGQLARNGNFQEVRGLSRGDLRGLPPGAVVVWNRGPGHPHGHISVALGNGTEASDVIRRQIQNYPSSFRVFMPN